MVVLGVVLVVLEVLLELLETQNPFSKTLFKDTKTHKARPYLRTQKPIKQDLIEGHKNP